MLKRLRPSPLLLASALATGALFGCSRAEPEAETAAEVAAEPTASQPAPAASPPTAEAPAAQASTEANASAEVPPETAVAADEQMMDDASATGMTSRASRDDETEPAAENVEAQ